MSSSSRTSSPTITIPRVPVPALEDVLEKEDQAPPKSRSRPNSGTMPSSPMSIVTLASPLTPANPVPVSEDGIEKDDQSRPILRSRPNSGTIPSSPILTTTLSSPRQSSVRFSSSHSNNESLPSLLSTSSLSGNSSPNPGSSRPGMPNRNSSRPGSSYSSAVQYKRPISSGSTLFARRAWPSTKLRGEIEKPWRQYPDPAHRWGKIIFWSLVGLGFAVGALCESFPLCFLYFCLYICFYQ